MNDRPRLKRAPQPRPRLNNLHLSKREQIATVRTDDDIDAPARIAPERYGYGSGDGDAEPAVFEMLHVERG